MGRPKARVTPPQQETGWYESWPPTWGEKMGPLDGAGLMECFVKGLEQSIDLLSCEEQRPRPVLKKQTKVAEENLHSRDFVKRHDEFLESLLLEQAKRKAGAVAQVPSDLQSSSSLSSTTSRVESEVETTTRESKRKRPMKLNRRSPVKKSPLRTTKRQIADISALEDIKKSSGGGGGGALQILGQISSKDLPEPKTYIHEKCRLQKDKGKGETPGSDICATGINGCLEKLRQKMELLTQVASGGGETKKRGKGAAKMKRRKARITEETHTYTETRSLIELRMGFLSMQYGVLLRWDTAGTGKVMLVVLRKMCHESFYTKEAITKKSGSGPVLPREPPAYVMRDKEGGNYVIMQRADGTEVTLLEPPYLVERPTDFGPAYISVSVLKIQGFNEKSLYTVHVNFDGTYHSTRLHYNPDHRYFSPRFRDTFEWEVSPSSLDLQLDLRVFEQKRPRHKRKKMAAHESVSLNFLDEKSSRVSHSRQITVPCRNNAKASITFALMYQSDYAHWLQQELNARRKEEATGVGVKVPFQKMNVEPAPQEPDYDIYNLCCIW